MTLYAEAELGIDSDQALGIFFAGFSAIGAVGVMLAPRIVRRVGLGRSVVAGGFVFGGGAMAAGLVSGPWAVIPFGIAMTGVSLVQVAFVTLRQRLTSAEVRGRVIAASRTIAYAGLPIGTILGGWIGDGIGLRQLFVGSGILISAIAAVLILGPLWQEHGPGAEPPPEAPPDAGPVDGHGPIGADPWLPMDGP
jgi:MFS family permease